MYYRSELAGAATYMLGRSCVCIHQTAAEFCVK